ncbi:MAG: peptidyl-prolyl cis-trans isomerase [Pseudomonadales bacterium]|nr:peptidyl-prolyl cis-trans isomerase [Pseudomonadales bacterium]NIX06543.1 peptidyl-prolyl cis-trans isomerase [Pseudomonadales bacterium]
MSNLRGLSRALILIALAALPGPAPADETELPGVVLETSVGSFEVELYPDRAPASVANFLSLVDDGFYDGLIFHRVIANFVIQTGGYDVDMGYREPPQTVVNESANGLTNRRGYLAMARLSDPDSADAQFYINVRDNPHLDFQPGSPGYTVFGRVVSGWEIVVEIELSDTVVRAGMVGVPEVPIVIRKAARR